ncbi:hypothetical protein [Clostridium sp.]|jgi:hypothetical protein|uniref:hypothetical protein n=1 Tax=Clostridium sp. TaxID=1506 RepID=UPI0039F5E730
MKLERRKDKPIYTNFNNYGNCGNNYKPNPQPKFCPEEPGTIIRISIPAGATLRLGFIEVTSPSGICLLVKLRKLFDKKNPIGDIADLAKKCGANIEILQE